MRPNVTNDLPIESISAYLLDLHRACHEFSLRAFQERCFERLKNVVAFDSGMVATGTLQRGMPHVHDSYLHRQTPAFMESWETVKHLDVVAAAALSHYNRTHRFDASETFADAPAMLAHCRAFGLEHVLCTAMVAERAGSYLALSIYRDSPDRPFTESDRRAVELVVPHVVDAMRQAKIEQLRRATRAGRPENQSAAIVNRAGLIIEAEPGFVDLLAETHPQWTGPWLPSSLAGLADARTEERRPLGRLVFRLSPREDLVLVHARRAHVLDDLTEREHQVARLFAGGESSKGVASQLAIAPNTVRVHLGRIYEKLGIVNKAELASMLADYD